MGNHSDSTSRRRFLASSAGLGVASIAGCLGGGNQGGGGVIEYNGDSPASVTYGAGGSGTLTNTTGSIMQSLVRDNSEKLRITPQETAGTEANQRLYSQGDVDFIGTSDWGHRKAKNEQPPFEEQPLSEPLPLQGFTYGLTHTYMLTRQDSDIEDWGDLEGKNVWPLWPGSTIRLPFVDLLQEIGLWENINRVDVSQSDIAGAMEEGRVDAAAVYGVNFLGLTGWAQQLDARMQLRAINMTDSMRQTASNFSGADYQEIEPYGWEQNVGKDTIDSVTMNWQIFFGKEISAELVDEIVRICHNNIEQARGIYGSCIDWGDPSLLSSVIMEDFPVHPGAAQVYRDLGVWKDSWTEGEVGSVQ